MHKNKMLWKTYHPPPQLIAAGQGASLPKHYQNEPGVRLKGSVVQSRQQIPASSGPDPALVFFPRNFVFHITVS